MEVVKATDKHIDDAAEWMRARGHKPFIRSLYEGGTGFAVDGLACVWVYPTRGPIALLEHLIANPDTDKDERSEAIDAVVTAAIDEAKRSGCRFIYSTTSSQSVVRRAERFGFSVAENANILMVADVGGV